MWNHADNFYLFRQYGNLPYCDSYGLEYGIGI